MEAHFTGPYTTARRPHQVVNGYYINGRNLGPRQDLDKTVQNIGDLLFQKRRIATTARSKVTKPIEEMLKPDHPS